MNDTKAAVGPATLHLSTVKLIEKMRDGTPGDKLTDEQLTEACGHDTRVGGRGYGYLQSAIKRCENHHGITWKRILGGDCIECLDNSGLMGLAESKRKHLRRVSKRTCRQLATADATQMGKDEKTEYLASVAQFGTLVQFAGTATTKKLVARNITEALDPARMLEALKE
jgi:hypothetical protein